MTIYSLEKHENETYIYIESENKVLFNRLEIAIDNILKEFDKKNKEKE